jgi:CheY-like chemotaxis protein
MPNILLVEDDAMIREMLARRLKWEGYQVITAANGAHAVTLVQSEPIDLILMDMGLPVMNGWQATNRIKASPATCAVPIIALTAYALTEDRRKCIDAGCDDYETKPIDFARLLVKIQGLLVHTTSDGRRSEA